MGPGCSQRGAASSANGGAAWEGRGGSPSGFLRFPPPRAEGINMWEETSSQFPGGDSKNKNKEIN